MLANRSDMCLPLGVLAGQNADMAKSTQLMLTQLVALLQTELKARRTLRQTGFGRLRAAR